MQKSRPLNSFLPTALLALSALCLSAFATPANAACAAVLSHTLPRLQDEKPVNLCDHAGKVVLVVNTASHCGFTPQYKALEALSDRYRERGLVVLGFPSNDFGGQEPAGNAQIADFCESTYGVRFPMFAKSVVRPGKGRVNPLYAALVQKTGTEPQWNFHKYLIDRRGDTVASVSPEVDPLSPAFLRQVEGLLTAK